MAKLATASASRVLRADGSRLELEFAHGFRRRAEFVVRATWQVHAEGDAIDQDFMREILATIDRSLTCAPDRPANC